MELKELGFDDWFQEKQTELQKPDCRVARVTRVDRDRYVVRNEENEVEAELTGRLRFSADASYDLPCVGDWVFVQYHNDDTLAIIHDRFPRKTFLRRKSSGRDIEYQIIAANIDVAFVIQACDFDFNVRRLERYLVMAGEGHVEPIILLSKTDLVTSEVLDERLSEIARARICARVVSFSNKSDIGLAAVRETLAQGKTYCLLGSSGVGKTTLLNRLVGRELLPTNAVRERDGRGRHTTAHRQLIVLDNGALLVDTPGMRELGLIGAGAGIDDSFSDIHELSRECRFNDCTHAVEVGCAVLTAVQEGELTAERYQNYMKLVKESAFHQMSYADRRKKDKKFGRMIKTVLKQKPKK